MVRLPLDVILYSAETATQSQPWGGSPKKIAGNPIHCFVALSCLFLFHHIRSIERAPTIWSLLSKFHLTLFLSNHLKIHGNLLAMILFEKSISVGAWRTFQDQNLKRVVVRTLNILGFFLRLLILHDICYRKLLRKSSVSISRISVVWMFSNLN